MWAVRPDDDWRGVLEPIITDTTWYRRLSSTEQNRLGRRRVLDTTHAAVEFEIGLIHTLAPFVENPATAPYLAQELTEETQHIRMFMGLIRGLTDHYDDYEPLGVGHATRAESFIKTAYNNEAVMWFMALCGEGPIDAYQRHILGIDRDYPSVLREVMFTHVREEAGHISFARHRLRELTPNLDRAQRRSVRMTIRYALPEMAQRILLPSFSALSQAGCTDPGTLRAEMADHIVAPMTAEVRTLATDLELWDPKTDVTVGAEAPGPRAWR